MSRIPLAGIGLALVPGLPRRIVAGRAIDIGRAEVAEIEMLGRL